MKRLVTKIITHPLAKNSLVVAVGSQSANFAGYLYHLFVGRILGPTQYGELAALLSLFYILNVPSTTLQTILVKFFSVFKARNESARAKGLFLSATKMVAICEAAAFVLLIGFFPLIANYLHLANIWNLVWLYILFSLFLLATVSGSVLQGYQKFTESVVYSNISVYLRVIFGIIFAFFGVGWTLIGNVLSVAISYVLNLLPIGFLLKQKTTRGDVSIKNMASYSVPALIATLGVVMLYSQDVIMVRHFFPNATAGIYSSLSILGKVIFFATSSINFILFPVLAERKELKRGYTQLVMIALLLVTAISLGLTTVYYLFPDFIVSLLFGSEYIAAGLLLGNFGLFISLYALSSMLVSILLALGKTSVWIFTTIAAVSQIIFLTLYHETLSMVIGVNMAITGGLFVCLMLYYAYEHRTK